MEIAYRLEGLEFEWDENKALSNVEKHGVTFKEAAEIFLDPFYVIGDASESREARAFALGYSTVDRLLLVVHMERGTKIRIISARVATRTERRVYEQA